MTKVKLKDEFFLSNGKHVLLIEADSSIKAGDTVETNSGKQYLVKGFILPTRPNQMNMLSLIVE